MNFDLQSHRTQLVLTAVAASAATAGLFSAYQQYTRRQKRRSLNDDVLRSLAASEEKGKGRQVTTADRQAIAGDAYTEELIQQQLARNYVFFGDEAMSKIRKGSVVIVGCGGVGSWAAVMLARSYVNYKSSARESCKTDIHTEVYQIFD